MNLTPWQLGSVAEKPKKLHLRPWPCEPQIMPLWPPRGIAPYQPCLRQAPESRAGGESGRAKGQCAVAVLTRRTYRNMVRWPKQRSWGGAERGVLAGLAVLGGIGAGGPWAEGAALKAGEDQRNETGSQGRDAGLPGDVAVVQGSPRRASLRPSRKARRSRSTAPNPSRSAATVGKSVTGTRAAGDSPSHRRSQIHSPPRTWASVSRTEGKLFLRSRRNCSRAGLASFRGVRGKELPGARPVGSYGCWNDLAQGGLDFPGHGGAEEAPHYAASLK